MLRRLYFTLRTHDQRGLTLTEILVSMVVFSLTLVGLVGLFLSVVAAGSIGEGSAMGFSLARACSEFLQSQGYLYVVSPLFMNPSDPCAAAPGLANPVRVPTLGRSYQLSATRAPSANYVDLIVKASWTLSFAGSTRTYARSLATRLSLNAP